MAALQALRESLAARRTALLPLLNEFPSVLDAFAYGSGALPQESGGRIDPTNMIDLIFVVDDAKAWHRENLARNRSHYSFLGSLGASTVACVQEMSVGVYYNTLVHTQGGLLIKYGVITRSRLVSELNDWTHFYLSGRMQKPVLPLVGSMVSASSSSSGGTMTTHDACEANRLNALRVVLLRSIPWSDRGHRRSISTLDLFKGVAALSYEGDVRMAVGGEHPRKVDNIVRNQLPLFVHTYESTLRRLQISADLDTVQLPPPSLDLLRELCAELPATARPPAPVDEGGAGEAVKFVNARIAQLVRDGSWSQTAKGVFTAGAIKSAVYALAKLKKGRSK